MVNARFKNDNRANSSLVIDSMLQQMEKHIEKMTGQRVKLTAEKIEEQTCKTVVEQFSINYEEEGPKDLTITTKIKTAAPAMARSGSFYFWFCGNVELTENKNCIKMELK